MKEQKKLMFQMYLFILFIIISLGLILLNELGNPILKTAAEKKINVYINESYKDNYNIDDLTYNRKDKAWEKKVSNKSNTKLYFTVSYKNKKIKDTYQSSYLSGESLLNYYQTKYTKELTVNNYPNIEVRFNKKLNEFNSSIQQKLIKTDNLKELSIYHIRLTKEISDFEVKTLTNTLLDLNHYIIKKEYQPSFYHIKLINNKNVLESIEIKNLKPHNINQETLEIIFTKILMNDLSITTEYDITYKYNNQGD